MNWDKIFKYFLWISIGAFSILSIYFKLIDDDIYFIFMSIGCLINIIMLYTMNNDERIKKIEKGK